MQKSTWLGGVLAVLTLVIGQILLGGSILQLLQPAALLIVLGGTLTCTLMAFSLADVRAAMRALPEIWRLSAGANSASLDETVEEIHRVATLVRKEGLLAAEAARESIREPFLKKLLKFSMDGLELDAVREIGEAEIAQRLSEEEQVSRVFEAAGGYAPAIGVLGAVLGLIQVLAQLQKPEALGSGIAISFLSLVYGLILANWALLPWGTKLKRAARDRAARREVVLMGALGVQAGIAPQVLREKLRVVSAAGADAEAKSAAKTTAKAG